MAMKSQHSLTSYFYSFFQLIVTCRLCVIYEREDNVHRAMLYDYTAYNRPCLFFFFLRLLNSLFLGNIYPGINELVLHPLFWTIIICPHPLYPVIPVLPINFTGCTFFANSPPHENSFGEFVKCSETPLRDRNASLSEEPEWAICDPSNRGEAKKNRLVTWRIRARTLGQNGDQPAAR